ncbi:MAG: 3-phosphoshikimate 1-carboxyvinyltransferase [Planctomycetaceae bacterium]
MSPTHQMVPAEGALHGTVRPPGSKSLTNRALLIAALARGRSTLVGALDSQDTRVMVDSLCRLGIPVAEDDHGLMVEGTGGVLPCRSADLWLENSGTSIRFLTAMCACGHGEFRLDGNARMRARPIADLVSALNALGGDVDCGENGCPPIHVNGRGLSGGSTRVSGAISSQFLSALLMASAQAESVVELHIDGRLVSRPYVDMTMGVMSHFGVDVQWTSATSLRVEPQAYVAARFSIEPDASAASYFFAAAAITGGEVTVSGLSHDALQGDVAFVHALEQMGCQADWTDDAITVRGGKLRGIDIDMNNISDTAQTLSVVAVFAEGPTRIRNIAHVRHKETDRIAAVATELRRMGIVVEEFSDGLTVQPGPPRPAEIQTYDDHRMAMSFALIGLRTPGIVIADPDCTIKTYPDFFDDLTQLCRGVR